MALSPARKRSSGARAEAKPRAAAVQPKAASSGAPLYVQASAMRPVRDVPLTTDKGAGADLGGGSSVVGMAHAGVARADTPLPHLDRIQAAFGAHDVSHVKAAVGGEGGETARRMGAHAYTVGDRVAFGREPDLHLAAHEAAHVVQQRSGVHLKDGVGRPGDHYERQADAAADAVVEGRSAEAVLGSPKPAAPASAGVQMACACGGTCASCSGAGKPAVQFSLASPMPHVVEPHIVIASVHAGMATGGGGGGAPAIAGPPAAAPTAASGRPPAAAGGANAPQDPAAAALDAEARHFGDQLCRGEPEPAPASQQGGSQEEDEEPECVDADQHATAPDSRFQDPSPGGPASNGPDGDQARNPPPDPPPAEIHGQAQRNPDNARNDQQAQQQADQQQAPAGSAQPQAPRPPPGCEAPAGAQGGAAGGGGAAARGGATPGGGPAAHGGAAPATHATGGGGGHAGGGGGAAPAAAQNDAAGPLAPTVRDAEQRRDAALEVFDGGHASMLSARTRVVGESSSAVRFAQVDGASERATGASAIATRALGEMGGEAAALTGELGDRIPAQLRAALVTVQADIAAGRDRTLAAIDIEFENARQAAHRSAASARAAISAQYIATAVQATAATALAVAQVGAATTRTVRALASAQRTQMGTLSRIFTEGEKKIVGAGVKKGNAAMAIGHAFWRQYKAGRINRRDSIMDGHLTDRRADARANAALETAKSFRDNFAQEAAAQARGFSRTKANQCAAVYKATVGAQHGVTTGGSQAISGLFQMLGTTLEQARTDRDTRMAAVATHLTAQLGEIAKQQRAQRQMAQDAAYLQALTAEHAAHELAGHLLRGAAQATSSVGDAIGDTRRALGSARPPGHAAVHRAMRDVHRRVRTSLGQIRGRVHGGLDRAVESILRHAPRAQAQDDRLTNGARDGAAQMSASFRDAMHAVIADAARTFGQTRAHYVAQTRTMTTTIAHTFQCALAGVWQSFDQMNASVTSGADQQAHQLEQSFDEQLHGNPAPPGLNLIRSIVKYACKAAANERPAWEEVAKFVLIIIVAIAISLVLGPVVLAAATAVLGAGTLATVVTAIIVGAIAGALSSAVGQGFDNLAHGRSVWHHMGRAALTGAITGAIGGALGGLGSVVGQAAARAGASIVTRFAIQFATDMATEYASQVTTNLMAGKGLSSFTNINASGFITAGAMSAVMFAAHGAHGPEAEGEAHGTAAEPRETAPAGERPAGEAPAAGEGPRPNVLERAGQRLAAADRAIGKLGPVRAVAERVGAIAERAGAVVDTVRGGASRLGAALRNTRLGQAIEGSETLATLKRYTPTELGNRLLRAATPTLERVSGSATATRIRAVLGTEEVQFPRAPTPAAPAPHEPPPLPHESAPVPPEAASVPHEGAAPPAHEPPAPPHEPPAPAPEAPAPAHEAPAPAHEPTPEREPMATHSADPARDATPRPDKTPASEALMGDLHGSPAQGDAPSPHDFETAEANRGKDGNELSRSELASERRIAEVGERRPIHEPPFREGGELPNGHEWKATEEGTFCRFSDGGGCIDSSGNEAELPRAYRGKDISKLPLAMRADPRLVVDMEFAGQGLPSSEANAAGWERNAQRYWEEMLERHPEAFSERNRRILRGEIPGVTSPTNDPQFRSVFKQYDQRGMRGEPLVHHHIGGGSQAFAVPASLHPGYGGIHNVEKELGIWGAETPISDMLERLRRSPPSTEE